jgi:predicted adenylyl cyclase CyaB
MMPEEKKYLEIETKYDASEINRLDFKTLIKTLNPKTFLYVEGRDIYYVKGENDFLRHRMAVEHIEDKRSELTFKKKSTDKNNNIRTEVNLRIDLNKPELVAAFCEGLGYKRNFSVYKMCDIYFFEDANVVYYTVIDDFGKTASFMEIEASEEIGLTEKDAWEVVQKYEKLLSPIGISAQKRKRLSLFEIYVKYENNSINPK